VTPVAPSPAPRTTRHAEWRARARAGWLAGAKPRELAVWIAAALSALLGLILLALAWATLRRFVLLVAISILFAYLVGPIVEGLRRRSRSAGLRMPRWVATLVAYAALALVTAVAWHFLLDFRHRELSSVVGMGRAALNLTVQRLRALDPLASAIPLPDATRSVVTGLASTLSSSLRVRAEATIVEVSEHLPYARWLWLVPVIAFVMLTEWPAFRRSAVRILPDGHLRWRSGEFLEQVNAALAGYTRAQLLACAVVGLLCAAGFAALGVPSPVALGLMAGVFEFFPVVGPLATALMVANEVSGMRLLLLLAFLLGLRVVQDYVIYPRLIGRRMHLSAAAVILAVLVGAELGGLVGVFCAVPTVGVLSVALRQYREYRDIERLVRAHGAAAQVSRAPGPVTDATPAMVLDEGTHERTTAGTDR
jgi:predicted PurR-regulated permease PerM